MTQGDCQDDSGAFAGARLLVAEDDALNRTLLSCHTRQFGCTVDFAEDGVEAIRLFQLNRYGIVLMDCQMPNLDGFEAARKIREFERHGAPRRATPIIALTAHDSEEHRAACHAAGMDGWLSKPYSAAQLRSTLEQWLMPPDSAIGARRGDIGAVVSAQPGASDIPDPMASASAVDAVLDRNVLEGIRGLETSEMPDILSKVVETYINSAMALLDTLMNAAAANDASAVPGAAHTLKSSSANVGAVRLSEMCRELENLSRRVDFSNIPALCHRIEDEFKSVCVALRAEVAKRKSL